MLEKLVASPVLVADPWESQARKIAISVSCHSPDRRFSQTSFLPRRTEMLHGVLGIRRIGR
jgi:hypothetical protein